MSKVKNSEDTGTIVMTKKIGNVTVHINDLYFRGKTREQCIEEINKAGKFKFIYVGKENVSSENIQK